MIPVLITLASIAIILFILSFFMNDRLKDVEDQVEQLSLQFMQDSYQIKKKLNVLEEELLSGDLTEDILKQSHYQKQSPTPPLVTRVQNLHKKGYSPSEIAKDTNLNEHDIHSILLQFKNEGAAR
ncbi:hypothetical protein MUO14_01710 [Halobacillus shinanisalinarum]|uniref:Uncharacterized protein n=1 Tax=Halobacillus shinanisalinarum TaxID=2932258 RepID=A0ABY4H0N2_9BACI|nr:hypothetical protein [Halobacillus shinanisalinarum]UOQ93741.1 hypothetical protein MUO14_01710 [Halobacillus shinanisalinarum]